MPLFRLHHRHQPDDCAVSYAAWKGFESPLRRSLTTSSCAFGGHDIWWDVEADSAAEALSLVPRYLVDRTSAARVAEVAIP